MFWRLFVAGFVLNKNNIRYWRFCRDTGDTKPRFSMDSPFRPTYGECPTIKMSEMSIDEPVEPFDDGNDFLKKIIENDNFYSLEEILEKKTTKKKQSFFKSGRDERYDILRDDMILNITLFHHQMKLLQKLESEQVSVLDKMEAINKYEDDIKSGEYLISLKKSGLMKDWDFPPIK